MNFAKWTFRIAGLWGLLIIIPLYFMEAQMGRDYPPAITHPEFYYGFLGVTLAWQVLFLLLSRDPRRYRPLMIAAVLEKVHYLPAVLWLYSQGRVAALQIGMGTIDIVFGALFVAAYILLGREAQAEPATRRDPLPRPLP
ncbi:MAG: hypothetical protein KIT87_04475 [Anaerolineae bacterium]|nr:hypothetical protein [Anaerolineae bacterium]